MSRFRSTTFEGTRALTLALALLFATAASGAAESKQDAEAALRARANTYWQARIANQTEVARAFYVPLPSGKLPVDIAEYGNVPFASYELEGIEVDGERGIVTVRVDASGIVRSVLGSHMEPPEGLLRPTLVEEWTQYEGTWRKIAPDRSLTRIGRKPAADADADAAAETEAKQ